MKIRTVTYMVMAAMTLASCSDDYAYDDSEPTWLGANIYDYLVSKGNYTSYLELIDQLGYKETLQRTGTKTLFPANDEAFAAYFKSINTGKQGPEAVKSMTPSGRRYLFNSSMLNMSYLDNMLANVSTSDDTSDDGEGTALVRETSASVLDTVSYVPAASLPTTDYWARFNDGRGIYLADNTARPNVFFTPYFMKKREMTSDDWTFISNGEEYDEKGFYVNGKQVKGGNRNLTCKNGYLHLAEDVVLPLRNMAEIVDQDERTQCFAHLMDKFSAPYYSADVDANVHAYYQDGSITDSVFVKRYFNDNGTGSCTTYPNGDEIGDANLLYFDPSCNQLAAPTDMGVMFVPTDEAMTNYWNSDRGKFLRDVYGEWDNVPNDVLSKFIKNHQLKSFVGAMPHEWDNLSDQKGFLLGVEKSDVVEPVMACNGMVYMTNKGFPPIDFQCAYAPTLTSPLTRIMKTAIDDNDDLKFHLYLRSLENQYNLLVPVDEAMKNYREPISWALWASTGVDKREIWSFKIQGEKIYVDIYNVNSDGSKGNLKQTIGATSTDQNRIMNRLRDIIDMHIVVADNEEEPMSGYLDEGKLQFALTKGGTILKVQGEGENTIVTGGGDVEQGWSGARLLSTFKTDNSHTFFIDHIVQDPFRSVYAELKRHSEFSEFYALLQADPDVMSYFQDDDDVQAIFDQMVSTQTSGIGQLVTTFNNYRYTILVPTNDAIKEAFSNDKKLWTWERISNEDNATTKKEHTLYLLNFLKRHIVDGAVPVGGLNINRSYDTAARDANNQFEKINVSVNGQQAVFGTNAKVITSNPELYNIITRDYIVDSNDPQKATSIVASSRAIIHLVDHVVKQ